jgi:hypothetical protein
MEEEERQEEEAEWPEPRDDPDEEPSEPWAKDKPAESRGDQ